MRVEGLDRGAQSQLAVRFNGGFLAASAAHPACDARAERAEAAAESAAAALAKQLAGD